MSLPAGPCVVDGVPPVGRSCVRSRGRRGSADRVVATPWSTLVSAAGPSDRADRADCSALPGIEMARHLLGSPGLVHGRGSDPQVPRERHPCVLHEGRAVPDARCRLLIDPAVRGVWKRATGSAARLALRDDRVERRPFDPDGLRRLAHPAHRAEAGLAICPPRRCRIPACERGGGCSPALDRVRRRSASRCAWLGSSRRRFGPDFLRPSVVTEASQLLRLDLTRTHDVFQPTGTFVDAGRFGTMAMLTYVSALALLLLTYRTSTARRRAFAVIGVMVAAGAIWAHAGQDRDHRRRSYRRRSLRSRRRSQIAGSRSSARSWLWRWSSGPSCSCSCCSPS